MLLAREVIRHARIDQRRVQTSIARPKLVDEVDNAAVNALDREVSQMAKIQSPQWPQTK